MKIIFLGTPDFAVASLDALVKAGYQIVGVVTATDKYGGRGNKVLIESAVKKYAVAQGLKVLQPSNLKKTEFLEELKSLQADLQIVVAFRMLPIVVWDMPPLGTYNLHGSYLPQYRGAAPINWVIINGETFTGVTTFKLKHEIDTGSIAYQEKIPIDIEDTAGTLHDKMMKVGAQLVVKTVKSIESGTIALTEQDDSVVPSAPKIFHEDCKIDYNQDCVSIYNLIRGMSPYPTSWFEYDGNKIKVYWANYELEEHGLKCGTIQTDNKHYWKVACKNGWIFLKDIQAAGRKRMTIKDFLNGYTVNQESATS